MVVAATAARDLNRLITVLSLPDNAKGRVIRTLRVLERFPLIGGQLGGRWERFRFILGPWRWMIIVYAFDAESDSVAVVAILDARSSASPFV